MPLIDLSPNNPQFALAAVRVLQTLDLPPDSPGISAAVTAFMGGSNFRINYNTGLPRPVFFGYAMSVDTMLIWIGGLKETSFIPRVVDDYINPMVDNSGVKCHGGFREWGRDIAYFSLSLAANVRPKLVVIGHSLGGAIGFETAGFHTSGLAGGKKLCTFGSPKVAQALSPRYRGAFDYARWTNPFDFVTALPPISAHAGLLYSTLTPARRVNLNSWQNNVDALSIDGNGIITQVPNGTETNVTVTSLASVFQGRNTLFGPGHSLDTYVGNLINATLRYAVPPPALVAPIVPGAQPVVALPPQNVAPRANPPLLPNVDLAGRLAAFREVILEQDALPVVIPFPNLMKPMQLNKLWYIEWSGYLVCLCPTKKKARALARHFNRFLRIYQLVGQSYSQDFTNALCDYLIAAADVTSEYRPLLNDGGLRPVPNIPLGAFDEAHDV